MEKSGSLRLTSTTPGGSEGAKRFRSHSMGECDQWVNHYERKIKLQKEKRYAIFSAQVCDDMAMRMQAANPARYKHFPILWSKFPDGTDDITIGGFHPFNEISGEHVIFLASFHNNDVTLSQFSSFIESLTIVLPYYPVGTNERVETEGKVATANTYSMLLSNLPSVGKPNRIMIYDIHALQERFYFHSSTVPSLHSSVPLLLRRLSTSDVQTVCFPDDGAAKRFSGMFKSAGYDLIICGKVRDGAKRIVRIQDGLPKEKHIVIVDDLVQTGGTLYECAVALLEAGALTVNAFVAHGVFPNQAWKNFSKTHDGRMAVFSKFWITNSVPTVTSQLPSGDVFEVLDLLPQILKDVDAF